jgi:hypothetical protein
MTKDKAIAALDSSFTDLMGVLFGVLARSSDLSAAGERFAAGFSNSLDAYAVAKAVIERKFPE